MSYDSVRDYKGDVKEFQAQRTNPIREYVTRKFYCEENVVGDVKETNLTQLSWNIHTPQEDFVWKSVKLHIPMRIAAKTSGNIDENQIVSMRLSDRNPASNVALSACPMKMFTDCQCIINGSMFSIQPNFYEPILDTCYQSRDENAWMSSHSLKPNANRNLRKATEVNGVYAVNANVDDEKGGYVQIHDGTSAISDHAFDLTFANPGFNSRVRAFQTDLQGSSTYCDTEIVSYLNIGPFMRRRRKMPNGERQYNAAVPFIKDFSLRLMCDKSPSEFDRQKGNAFNDEQWPGRTLASSILEWGTPVNMRHIGESQMPDINWAGLYSFEITSQPYLEVEYVKLGRELAPSYKLRAITYQHEKSDPFSFEFPLMSDSTTRLVCPPVPVRINSRLLEVCSKVYVWCELAQEYKKSFFLGGTQRCTKIDKIHLRIGNRSDILFEPTQLSLFDNFKKLTSNSWGFSTWEKSPIYVFDPASFGLQELLAGQAQLLSYEWNMEVQPTELMIEEFVALERQRVIRSLGYTDNVVFQALAAFPNHYTFTHYFQSVNMHLNGIIRKYQDWKPSPTDTLAPIPQGNQAPVSEWGKIKSLIPTAHRYVAAHQAVVWMEFRMQRTCDTTIDTARQLLVTNHQGLPQQKIWSNALQNYLFKPMAGDNVNEMWRIKRTLGHQIRFDGFVWALVNIDTTQAGQKTYPIHNMDSVGAHGMLWYVPEGFPMSMSQKNYQRQHSQFEYFNKRLFSNIDDFNFTTNTWAPGKAPVWDDVTGGGEGFITGSMTYINRLGVVQTSPFNSNVALAGAEIAPGIRAYPLQINNGQNIIQGIRNIAVNDGGTRAQRATDTNNQAQNHLRGGIRAAAMVAPAAIPTYPYVSQRNENDGQNQQHYKWIAFQLTPEAAVGPLTDGTFLNHVGAQGSGWFSGNNVPMGDIQEFIRPANNSHIGRDQGYETHICQCVVERDVFNTANRNIDRGYLDYGHRAGGGTTYDPGADSPRFGQMFTSSAVAAESNVESNSLKFETNVLYEFGQKSYVIEKDGKMVSSVESYPSITRDENVVQGRSTVSDSRLPNLNEERNPYDYAPDEFNIQ